jgi:hypothetical protein
MIDLDTLHEQLEEAGALLLEPRGVYDSALIGITEGNFGNRVAVYETGKVIQALMDAHDWEYEDAQEWFDFNVAGAYVGESTPQFMDLLVRE